MWAVINIVILAALAAPVRGEAEVRIGDCSGDQFQANNFVCQVDFWIDLKSDPTGDCNSKYERMFNCTREVIKTCLETSYDGATLASLINIFLMIITKAAEARTIYCQHGGIALSFLTQHNTDNSNSGCSDEFYQTTPSCDDEFHRIFANNPADSRLCRLYNKSMSCVVDKIDDYCTDEEGQLLKLNLHLENPICQADKILGITEVTTSSGRPTTLDTLGNTESSKLDTFLSKWTETSTEKKVTEKMKVIKKEEKDDDITNGHACIRFDVKALIFVFVYCLMIG